MTAIKNIIFDLGGVILNLDFDKTFEAFDKLGFKNVRDFFVQHQNALLGDFDTGKINATDFRNMIRTFFNLEVSDAVFDEAWNAMLVNFPEKHLKLIKDLQQKYHLYLYSNINEIHLNHINAICTKENIDIFETCFVKKYYSFQVGKRKPNREALELVVKENQLTPSETLFVDDSLDNVIAARDLGLHALHINREQSLIEIEQWIDSLCRRG